MRAHTYKKLELVGTSIDSIENAIQGAISKTATTHRNLEWFEVTEIRGWIAEGKVQHFQVALKLGLREED